MYLNKRILALQTARSNSKGVKKKNILKINNKYLFYQSINAAKKSKFIDKIICSTDDLIIKKKLKKEKIEFINRPRYLAGDLVSHIDVIKHGVNYCEKKYNVRYDIIVLLLGNIVGIDHKALDDAIIKLKNNDSIVSVSKFNMFNPYRALKIKKNKLVRYCNYTKKNKVKNMNDRNKAGDIYFCNGNFWIFKRKNLAMQNFSSVFPWLGKKIKPYLQNPFMELDESWQLNFLQYSSKFKKTEIK